MDHLDRRSLTFVGVVWLQLASVHTGRAFALFAAVCLC